MAKKKTDEIVIRYTALSDCRLWDRNPKKHDLGAIIRAIRRHGFKDAPIYDKNINGIIAGNGRVTALATMKTDGESPPKFIGVEGDEWYVPIQYGADAPNREEAEAFGIDHNAITILGGDLGLESIIGLFREDRLVETLEAMGRDALPISIDGDDLDMLLNPPPPGDQGHFPETGELDDLVGKIKLPLDLDNDCLVEMGEVWYVGPHALVIADVVTDWIRWVPLLEDGTVFVPYPEPLMSFADVRGVVMIMVTPDTFAAAHLLTRAKQFGLEVKRAGD